MTSTEEWGRPGRPSGQPTAAAVTNERTEAEVRDDFATETTGLLSANTDSPGKQPGTREAVWTGYADFEGLPWWKRPSVCLIIS